MPDRICAGANQRGEVCKQAPLVGSLLCFWHDPENAEAAREARRLGGVRRRREGTVRGAYDVASLDSVAGLRRLLDIAVADTLSLDNSVARNRIIVAVVTAGGALLEKGELQSRLEAIETVLGERLKTEKRGTR